MRKYIQKTDSNKSTDADDITADTKERLTQLENPITLLVNQSLTQADTPYMEKGKRNPNLLNGDKKKYIDYSSISLMRV